MFVLAGVHADFSIPSHGVQLLLKGSQKFSGRPRDIITPVGPESDTTLVGADLGLDQCVDRRWVHLINCNWVYVGAEHDCGTTRLCKNNGYQLLNSNQVMLWKKPSKRSQKNFQRQQLWMSKEIKLYLKP